MRHLLRSLPLSASVVLALFAISMEMAAVARSQSLAIDLSHQSVGAPPRDFEFWSLGKGDAGRWRIVQDVGGDENLAVQEAGLDHDEEASLAVYAPVVATNIRARTRFKLMQGTRPGAGLALRVAGPHSYYVVRASASEQRVSLLHVVGGVSKEIAGVDADIAWDRWQTLDVAVVDNGFKIELDGRWILTAFDYGGNLGGRCGLWTEHAKLVRFDQIELTPLPPHNWSGMQDEIRE